MGFAVLDFSILPFHGRYTVEAGKADVELITLMEAASFLGELVQG